MSHMQFVHGRCLPFRLVVLVRIVLVRPVVVHIMLVVHTLGAALRLVRRLLTVEPVLAFGLGELVDFGAGEAREELFGESVGDGFAWAKVSNIHPSEVYGVCLVRGVGGVMKERKVEERRTFFALVILKRLETSECCAAGYDFMAEAGLVLLEVVVVVDLVVRLL
jgi:hypothetical protein